MSCPDRPEPSRDKPRHLGAEYAAQFSDEEVAAAYHHRPPYPAEAFDVVESLLGPRPRRVLELGAGTGDFTIGLAPRVDHLIAVEPSRPMRERARLREGAGDASVQWLAVSAEDYAFDQRYSAVVSAEAFHWLDWFRVVPRIAASLVAGGQLILIQRAVVPPLPWEPELGPLIRRYTTNREWVPYDTATELETRGLITVGGRARTRPVRHRQSVGAYVESFHSRNGFSRARLAAESAEAFDDELGALVRRHCRDDRVDLLVEARIAWGRPLGFTIRPARPDDAPRVHELHTVSVRTLCAEHYAPDVIDGWLVNRTPGDYLRSIERGDLFVAERDGRVVGFGEAAPGRVVAVYVDPSAARQGVGRAILRHAIGKAGGDGHGPVRLEATLNARDFYAREGFRELARFSIRRNLVDVPVVFMELTTP